MPQPHPRPVVIVTGSSGLLGVSVCNQLAPQFEVVGFDRAGPPYPPPAAHCISVDMSDESSIFNALEQVMQRFGSHISAVIHLAAYYDFSGRPSPLYQEVTVKGTARLLRQLRRFQVEQFIFSSTMLVHAPTTRGHPIDETWPLQPKWDYPRSKVETEHVIHELHNSIPAVILRIAGVYTDDCQSIPLAHQIQRIYERQLTSRVFPGNLNHGQAFVHLTDVVDAIWHCVQRRHLLDRETVLLVGEDRTLSYGRLQQLLGMLIHNERWHTYTIPKSLARAGAWVQQKVPGFDSFIAPWMIDLADDHYELDITRARHMLDWQPHRNLESTLPTMIARLKADPANWYRRNRLKLAESRPTAVDKKLRKAA